MIVIDCHSHATGFDLWNLGARRFPTSQSVLDFADRLARNEVDFAATYPLATSFHFDLNRLVAGQLSDDGPEPFPYAFLNRQHLYESFHFGQQRILPFAAVDPQREVAAQLDYLAKVAGCLFGLKYHTRTTAGHPNHLIGSGLLELAIEFDLPITIHSARHPTDCDPQYIVALAERYPQARFNIAHAAAFRDSVLHAVAALDNVFVDCAPWYVNLDEVQNNQWDDVAQLSFEDPMQALAELYEIIPNALLWGSDAPWTSYADSAGNPVSLHSYEDEAGLLFDLPPEIRYRIACENPARWLFGRPLADDALRAAVATRHSSLREFHSGLLDARNLRSQFREDNTS
jgi:hypothetical protein